MAQLKTQRLAANDLFSTYPNGQGSLEGDLCTIFGFAPNVDITASPVSLDNSGRVVSTTLNINNTISASQPPNYGMAIWDSSGHKQSVIGLNHALQAFTVQSIANPGVFGGLNPIGPPVFGVAFGTGNLTGSTKQDTVQTPLIPALSGAQPGAYYNTTGVWNIPGQLPFSGCYLQPIATTVGSASNGFQTFATPANNPLSFDVGGHFDGVNKISAIAAGKYFISVVIPVYALGGANLTAQIFIQDDGTNNMATASTAASSVTGKFLATSTIWNASSGSSWIKIYCTDTTPLGAGAVFGSDNGIVSGTKILNGALSFFRME